MNTIRYKAKTYVFNLIKLIHSGVLIPYLHLGQLIIEAEIGHPVRTDGSVKETTLIVASESNNVRECDTFPMKKRSRSHNGGRSFVALFLAT